MSDAVNALQPAIVTRSGSIGRVSFITKRFDNAIVSDDLIRVRISDASLAFYVLAFLQTRYAQDQMLRNEYGAIQQHLEPEHVRDLLVPMPEDPDLVKKIVATAKKSIEARELLESLNDQMISDLTLSVATAIGKNGSGKAKKSSQ